MFDLEEFADCGGVTLSAKQLARVVQVGHVPLAFLSLRMKLELLDQKSRALLHHDNVDAVKGD